MIYLQLIAQHQINTGLGVPRHWPESRGVDPEYATKYPNLTFLLLVNAKGFACWDVLSYCNNRAFMSKPKREVHVSQLSLSVISVSLSSAALYWNINTGGNSGTKSSAWIRCVWTAFFCIWIKHIPYLRLNAFHFLYYSPDWFCHKKW